ncbi:MAG: uroporphyrinogen decarboxylase family protein, partial [Promethearchaeota archaeon]
DAITIADPTGSSDMISPKHFEQLSFPSLKELITKLKSHGVKVGLHICGNTRPILHLMVKTGADYIEVDQAVDLKEARIEAQKTCIIGNVGTSDLLSGSKESIIELSENCIEKIGENGYILSSGCEVPYGTPIENIQAMVETATKHQKA